jgi:type II secretory pathway pseudopilin PulG
MISKPQTLKKLSKDQSGLAAIIVVLIVIVLLTMIVFTFARISQRNQRQVLDRQLDTAAYYAAESGINDAREWIRQNPTAVKETCDMPPPEPGWPNASEEGKLDGEELSYPCVLVTPVPDSLKYDNVESGDSRVLPVKPIGGNLSSIEIAWQEVGGGTNFSCPSNNPKEDWNCDPGILQIDLIPLQQGSSINRDYFINRTMTVFARPSAGSVDENGTVGYATARGFGNQGATVSAKCNSASSSKHCRLKIENFSDPGFTPNSAYIKVTPHYKSADIEVCSPECGSASEGLVGAQWVVDSTGRAADVLKRLQVRLSAETYENNQPVFSNAIHTAQSICKRFEIGDGVYKDPSKADGYPAECWLKQTIPGGGDDPIVIPDPDPEPLACVDKVTFTMTEAVDGVLAAFTSQFFPEWKTQHTILNTNLGACRYRLTMVAYEDAHARHDPDTVGSDTGEVLCRRLCC